MKTKITYPEKYQELLEIANNRKNYSRYNNSIYIHDRTKTVISTDGNQLLARRDIYPETKTLARLLDSPNSLFFNSDTSAFSYNCHGVLELDRVIPNLNELSSGYFKIGMLIPKWIKAISKKEQRITVSLILGDEPILAIGGGYNNAVTFNAKFLQRFSGRHITVYVKKHDITTPLFIIPTNRTPEDSEWFYIFCGMKMTDEFNPYIVKDRPNG